MNALGPIELIAPLALLGLGACSPTAPNARSAMQSTEAARAVLDDFHDAAAKGDFERYFGHFTGDAMFVGTDASEHWTVAEFKEYARPHFDGVEAWTYVPRDHWMRLDSRGWCAFEEQLEHATYGLVRGSGLLVQEGGTWKIAQYVLSFPVPNDKAAAVVELIRGG